MKTSAILITGINRVEMGRVQIPDPGHDEVMTETLFSCISPGTELRVLSGQQAQMENYPLIPGYATVGRVIARGNLVTIPEGALVFSPGASQATGCQRMWGGHVAHAVQPQNRVFVIPPGVDPVAASVAKLSAISLHGSRVAPALPQDRVLVAGLGPIGQLSARHYDLSGANVIAVDIVPWRVELAKKAGIHAILAGENLAATVHKFWPDGADIISDCTGSAAAFTELVKLARNPLWDDQPLPHRTTTYMFQGSYLSDITLPYWDAFHTELRLVMPRDQQPQDLRFSLERLASGKLKTRDLVSDLRRPTEAARAYADLQDHRQNILTLAFDWRDQTA